MVLTGKVWSIYGMVLTWESVECLRNGIDRESVECLRNGTDRESVECLRNGTD